VLNREIVKAIAAPEVRERLSNLGYLPVSNTATEFATLIATDLERYAKIIREAKIRAED
jgi:tripartite-type tricarboxylate transporter receptor subunit TctC